MLDVYFGNMDGVEVHAETPEEEQEAAFILNSALSGKTTFLGGCLCPSEADSTVSKGFRLSIIDYIQYAKDAYLIFSVQNYYARFAEKESNPKYYFSDNGLLNLFLDDKKPSLLENAVAVYLTQNHPQDVFYLKSPKTGIDIDFYIPSARQVVQVAYSIQGDAYEREVGNLKKFAATTTETHRYVIVTYEEEKIINDSDVKIEVVPLMKFLLKC